MNCSTPLTPGTGRQQNGGLHDDRRFTVTNAVIANGTSSKPSACLLEQAYYPLAHIRILADNNLSVEVIINGRQSPDTFLFRDLAAIFDI